MEFSGDLFRMALPTSAVGHCVSQCYKMGKGIAVEFRKRFGGIEELIAQRVPIGGLGVLKREGKWIYYLVTKERFFHKPTYASIESSIRAMKQHAVEHKVTDIALPRIGCGLDKLEWPKVKKMLETAFCDTGIRLSIYVSNIEPYTRSAPGPDETGSSRQRKLPFVRK